MLKILAVLAIIIALVFFGWFYMEVDASNKRIEICVDAGFEGALNNETDWVCAKQTWINNTLTTQFVKVSDLGG